MPMQCLFRRLGMQHIMCLHAVILVCLHASMCVYISAYTSTRFISCLSLGQPSPSLWDCGKIPAQMWGIFPLGSDRNFHHPMWTGLSHNGAVVDKMSSIVEFQALSLGIFCVTTSSFLQYQGILCPMCLYYVCVCVCVCVQYTKVPPHSGHG